MNIVKRFFYNGNILTMDSNMERAQALVTEDDKIVFVGGYDEAKTYTDDKTVTIDLKGRTLLPGFNDSHMHLISYGLSKNKVDLTEVKSIKELQKSIEAFVNNEENRLFKDWVLGSGWNHEKFDDKRLPTKKDLDQVVKDRPVFLSRACYHICTVNSKALELAGITKDTKDPEGGKIDRDPVTGEPTGVLRENALYLAYSLIPFTEDTEDIKDLITKSIEDANRAGITSIQTDDFSHLKSYEKVIDAYQQLKEENKLKARINFQMLLKDKSRLSEFLKSEIKTGDGDIWVRFGPLKILGDGSLGSRTAALEAPYNDDETTKGVLIYRDEELKEILELAHTHGLQLAVHAIGDRCMNQVLDIYAYLSKTYPKADPRFRVIHCQIASEEVLDKFKKLDVIGDIQPVFTKTDLYMAEDRVGKERMKWSYAWKTMLDKGIRLSGSSDAPVEPFEPILGIYAAAARQDLDGYPKGGWYPKERLSLLEALKLYTTKAAYSTYEEDIKGQIKKGMLADLVILSENIEELELSDIKDVKVDMTLLGGKVVFER